MKLKIYTDGCCFGNHDRNERFAGAGVFIDDFDFTLSKELPSCYTRTNHAAELYAILLAMREAREICDEYNVSQIQIFTDSQYACDIYLKYARGWMNNGWRKRNGDPIANVDIIKKTYRIIREIIDNRISKIQMHKVAGHSDCYGNDEAHRLATEAAEAQKKREQRERRNNRGRRNDQENVVRINTVYCNYE